MVIHANTDGDLQSRVEVDFHITGFMNKKKSNSEYQESNYMRHQFR